MVPNAIHDALILFRARPFAVDQKGPFATQNQAAKGRKTGPGRQGRMKRHAKRIVPACKKAGITERNHYRYRRGIRRLERRPRQAPEAAGEGGQSAEEAGREFVTQDSESDS